MKRYFRGSVLVYTLFILMMLLVSGLALATVTLMQQRGATGLGDSVNAFQAANDGFEDLIAKYRKTTGTKLEDLGGCSDGTISQTVGGRGYAATFQKKDASGNLVSALCTDNLSDIERVKVVATVGSSTRAIETEFEIQCIGISIRTCDDLQKIGNDSAYPLDGSYCVKNDIDCGATDPTNAGNAGSVWDKNAATSYGFGGKGFEPIGINETGFSGSFDGGGHIVKDVYINRVDSDYIGLFAKNFSKGIIQNIGLQDVSIHGKNWVGGLVGANYQGGKIKNSYTTGSVTLSTENSYVGAAYVGGLVGAQWQDEGGRNAEIQNSYSSVSVSANIPDNSTVPYIGGLVGSQSQEAIIIDSFSNGSVSFSGPAGYTGTAFFGGLVGRQFDLSTEIRRSYSTASVSGIGSNVGCFLGSQSQSSVRDSYWKTSLGCSQNNTSGLTGLDESAMKKLSSYSGEWDFSAVWQIDDNESYPCFKWQGDVLICPR